MPSYSGFRPKATADLRSQNDRSQSFAGLHAESDWSARGRPTIMVFHSAPNSAFGIIPACQAQVSAWLVVGNRRPVQG